jgi:predicted dehydrogenase
MKRVSVGVIGCGNISAAYLKAAKTFPILDIVALADLNPNAAAARSAEFDAPARSVDEVLADPAIEVVLNLTIPKAHVEVGLRAINAGKHVHSEKPLGVTVAEARTLIEAAQAKGLRLGSAPDTFLGGAHQTARQCADDGLIGRPVGGTAFFMCPATSVGIRARPSTISAAAARCSTWAPTMSRVSSTCSGPWRASQASPRGPARSASSRAPRSRGREFRSRSRHTSPAF